MDIKEHLKLENLSLQRVVIEVIGSCNYTCQMCPQGSEEGREKSFLRKMPLHIFENILDQLTPKYGHPLINLEGSGEPTLAKDLALYVEACTRRGLRTFMYCNGSNFNGDYMKDVIDAGLGLIRFSVIGYNSPLYHKWMSANNFDLIINNAKETKAYTKKTLSECSVESYHLLLNPDHMDFEVSQYRKNFIDVAGTVGYIWKMHNWSGNFDPSYSRSGIRRSCGRPAAAELTIRAGGHKGHNAAVTPCCQVLGSPTESMSVLGHLDSESFEDIWYGERYTNLRKAHELNTYEDLAPYCQNCDFLVKEDDALVWSNNEDVRVGIPLGVGNNLIINQ